MFDDGFSRKLISKHSQTPQNSLKHKNNKMLSKYDDDRNRENALEPSFGLKIRRVVMCRREDSDFCGPRP